MVVTIAFSSLLLRLSPSSATILVAWRTWITVHIIQIIHLYGVSYLIWPSSDGWAWSGPPPKRKKNICWARLAQSFWAKIDPTQSFIGWVRPSRHIYIN
jgi:hypothetical protein